MSRVTHRYLWEWGARRPWDPGGDLGEARNTRSFVILEPLLRQVGCLGLPRPSIESLSQVTAPTPSLPLLAKTLPGVLIQAVPISARSTKAERRKADKEKKAAKLKPICVKTPGAPVFGSSGDKDSSDDDESEDKKVAEEKKKAEKKKLLRSNSSVSVKEFAGAFNELSKQHKEAHSSQKEEG